MLDEEETTIAKLIARECRTSRRHCGSPEASPCSERADVEDTRKMAEAYLQKFTQHVEGEEYLLVGFVDPHPQCWWFRVIGNGRLEPDTVEFVEIQLSKPAVAGRAL